MAALVFIVETLLSLYLMAVLLRLLLQWTRANFRNPLAQALLQLTNPVIVPLRRLLPPIGRLDTATVLVALLTALAQVTVRPLLFAHVLPPLLTWLEGAVLQLVRMVLWIELVAVVLYAVLSMVAGSFDSPAQDLSAALAQPVLRPIRRFLPSVKGLDLSPLWAAILLQALLILLP